MAFQYLKTKLDIPATREKKLPRPKLNRLLGDSGINKTILVSAPAGFGKTSMIIEWVTDRKDSFAWISLDETDNDPVRFYGYLKEALKRIHPALGETEDYLSSYPSVPISTSLTILLNAMAEYKQPLFIVLDDYHVITNPEVHEMTSFLIQHSAVGVNFIISTRLDPPLPLDRWRVMGNLLEVRQSELSFSKEDVEILLNQIMKLNLTATDVTSLNEKTEGWIAGLHIAALFLAKREDKAAAISEFSGNHAHIMNYLVAEVILGQPESMRSFLLDCSILDELSEQLCNFVTGRSDSRSMLDQLYVENQFIIQLDNRQRRYRFHKLFSDVLQSLLKQEDSAKISNLYLRASLWYEKNNMLDEAIKLAFKGDDHKRAIALIEKYATTALEEGERATIREWMERLSEKDISENPVLNLMHAWSIMNDKTIVSDELFIKRVSTAEAIVSGADSYGDDDTTSNAILTSRLADTITLLKAVFAFERGNPSRLFLPDLTRMLDQSDSRFKSAMFFLLAHMQIRTMELDNALQTLDNTVALAKSKNYIYLATYATYLKAWILFQRGNFHLALKVCQAGLETLVLSKTQSESNLPISSALKIMIASVYYEWNRLEEANVMLDEALIPLKNTTEVGIIIFGTIKQVMVKISLGITQIAIKPFLTSLSMMERFHTITADLVEVMQLKLSTSIGNSSLDTLNAENQKIPAAMLLGGAEYFEQELAYYQDYDWQLSKELIRVQVYLHTSFRFEQQLDQKTGNILKDFLKKHIEGCKKWGLTKWIIELLISLACVCELLKDEESSLHYLEQSLSLAVPEEVIRVFLDHGMILIQPLQKILKRGRFVDFISKILSNMKDKKSQPLLTPETLELEAFETNVELSSREYEVLILIAEGYSNRDISSQLFISLNTVKSHVSHIFDKLQVNRRTKAISTAKKMGIL